MIQTEIACISDLHIRDPKSEAYDYLLRFLKHEDVRKQHSIVLLGDIFDVMCGPHLQYASLFPEFFSLLAQCLEEKKMVRYFEGNHDVFLQGMFRKAFAQLGVDASRFRVHRSAYIENGIYLSHGDEITVKRDMSYALYKGFLLTSAAEFIAEHLVPYGPIDYLGQRASKMSRKRSMMISEDFKSKIRERVTQIAKRYHVHTVISGHTHVQDAYATNGFRYLNNGDPRETHTFLIVKEGQHEFISF